MIQTIGQIFATGKQEEITSVIQTALKTSNESPMWTEKAIPLSEAVLSVLIPLRQQNLLITPEGNEATTLTPALFLRYCDLANLKWLAFTLQKSNALSTLERSKYTTEQAAKYEAIDLSKLGAYLSSYTVNLEDEWLDFPIANYNLHIGVTDLLKKLI
ncbi:MAG: hypothetical protein PF439_07700 [Helicobacteraceae bacterium]|jgi:hypothetical protein|nr:hypothetical protein [Helicobacteraceae bacterium]